MVSIMSELPAVASQSLPVSIGSEMFSSPSIVRPDFLARIVEPQSALILITGDSGTGKTHLLRRASVSSTHGQAALSEFRSTTGSLQVTLLRMLGDVVNKWHSEESVGERFRAGLAKFAERAVTATASEMGKAAGKFVLSYLKGKVGADTIEILDAVIKELATPNDLLLEHRIRDATDGDVLDSFIALSSEVRDMVGDFVLYVDAAERLTSDDFAALVDLSDRLPEGVSIVASMTVGTAAQSDRVRAAEERGVEALEIPQLEVSDVEKWLRAVGLGIEFAPEIRRLTGGYPVFIETCLRLIQSGSSLTDIDTSRSYRSITQRSWHQLTDHAQVAAQLLLPFDIPLSIDIITAITGIDANAWSTVENRLREARIYCATGSGRFWFHERRRQILWNDLLTQDQRRAVAERVAPVLSEIGKSGDDRVDEVLAPLADMAALASVYTRSFQDVQDVLDLKTGEVATLFALLELLEPPGEEPAFIDSDDLLSYRRALFPGLADAVPSLETLVRSGLVYVASDENASIATATIASAEAFTVLEGRFVREFGRLPLARAASAIFEVGLRRRLGPFKIVQFGIGRPTIHTLVRNLPSGPPLLVMFAEIGIRHFYLGASFDDEESRDAAIERVKAEPIRVFDEGMEVRYLQPHPGAPIPAQRFSIALREVFLLSSSRTLATGALDHEASVIAAAQIRLEVYDFVRSRLDEVEARRYDCAEPMALFVDGSSGGFMEVEVRGSRRGVERMQISDRVARGPMMFFLLSEALDLGADETIRRVSFYSGARQDPVVEQLDLLRKAAEASNGRPKTYYLPRDNDLLTEDLIDAFRVRSLDIQHLQQVFHNHQLDRVDIVRARHLCWLYSGERGRNLGGSRTYFAMDIQLPSEECSIEIAFGDPPPKSYGDLATWLESERGIIPGVARNSVITSGIATSVLGRLLGHSEKDVRILPDVYASAALRSSGPL
jgi:hypothetical protein